MQAGGISSINIPSDYAGNTFISVMTSTQGSGGSSIFVGEYYAVVKSTITSDTIVATWGSNAAAWLDVLVIRGYTANGLGSSSGQGTSGSACSVSSTTGNSGSIVIGFCDANSLFNPTCTPASSFALLYCFTGTMASAYSANWGGSAYNNLLSFTGGPSNWNAVAASFDVLPSVSITSSTSSGTAPLGVSFTSSVSGGSGGYSYAWTFGNGKTSQSAAPSITYSSPGNYLVQLTVTDSSGAQVSATLTVSVTSATTTTIRTTGTTNTTSTSKTNQSSTILSLVGLEDNITVDSAQIKGTLSLSENLSISNAQSSTTIEYILYNSTAVEFVFPSPGPVSLSLDTIQAPFSVWANTNPISSWVYNNGTLSITSDPSSITIIFPSQSSTTPPVTSFTQFLESNWILLLIIVVLAASAFGAAVRRR